MRDSHHPVTIKTSAPSLDGVIERPRLIDAIVALPTAAKWLQAPSGTGKSTLAASYARTRKQTIVWYRLDERDNDPAFFYAEFAQAVRAQLSLTAQLPKFSGDDHDRQQEFAQRFAAALSEQLAKPALIVLDDVQCITNRAMQRAFAALIAAAGNGIELLFVSQSIAPTAFFDTIAARQLALLNDADLRFDLDECKAMIAALRIGDAHSESIAALTGGHAGALILACELLRGTDPKSALGVATVERIHSHLLTKLVEQMPQARRELLLQTAFVTQLTRPITEALAGHEAAHELDALVESGLLRRIGTGETEAFEAHGLVQQGIRALVRARLGEARAQDLAQQTATTLLANGQCEAAFSLLVDIGVTARAIDVLQQLAEQYAARGQTDLLLNALAKVPTAEVHSNAWLCFWTGQALLSIDEGQARVWLARSYSAFSASGDHAGVRLAAASVVTAFQLECNDLRELDNWVGTHRNAGGDTPVPAGDRFEATLSMGVICAAFVCATYPSSIDSDALIVRMRSLIDSEPEWLSEDQRVQAARLLIEHARVFAKFEQARSIIIATRFLIDREIGGTLHRGRWLIAAAQAHYSSGDAVGAVKYLEEARSLAQQSESAPLFFELSFQFADHWMKAQDLQLAADELHKVEELVTTAAPAPRAEYAKLMTRLLLLQGRLPEGLRWAEEAMRIAPPAGFKGANLRAFEVELVYALAANERLSEAHALATRLDFEPLQAPLAIRHCLRFLLEDQNDLEALRKGLRSAAEIGFVNLLDRARAPLARICEAALAHDIEPDFVRRLIAVKQLMPPPLAGPKWPWSVHVKTLGDFQLNIHGQRYKPPHKAQDKPLELLKLLVTCQALGRESAEKAWAAERLWPDADAENARKSLDMTLTRLRRLLGEDDAIVAHEGRLQLSATKVWTDIRLLRAALTQVRFHRDEHAKGKPTVHAATSIAALLEHYTGVYLADEDGPPWLLAGREAIVTAVRHALVTADTVLKGESDELLVPALERALVADPTSEDLAQALMRAYLRGGRNSEVLRTYRRLREMLSLLLGVAPSVESEHIRDQAYAAESKSGVKQLG